MGALIHPPFILAVYKGQINPTCPIKLIAATHERSSDNDKKNKQYND
jgi:hypothetical protein